MTKISKIDKLRIDLLASILKSDKWEKKNPSNEEFGRLDFYLKKKKVKELSELKQEELDCLYKYVGELERTHPHFNQK